MVCKTKSNTHRIQSQILDNNHIIYDYKISIGYILFECVYSPSAPQNPIPRIYRDKAKTKQ